MASLPRSPLTLLLLALVLPPGGLACSSDSSDPPAGTGGSPGTGGRGGQGGQPSGSGGGSGGSGTGGTGGATGSGGASGSGGGDAGGEAGETLGDAGSVDATGAGDSAGAGDGSSSPDLPAAAPSALTMGWTQKEFTFAIHKPYDLQESDRYSFDPATGVHTLFVLKTDKAHQPNNTTAPRTEIRMRNDYTSGNHQFEADVMVVAGTDGPSIMQVFGGQIHATAFMLKASSPNGGTVRRYDNEVLKTNVYDKWFHLNVIHEALPAGIGKVKVYIDGAHVGTFDDRDTAQHYFKVGVYGPASARAEARFRNIRYWVKP